MFAQKFWLGLEWREEEEGLNPKHTRGEGKENKTTNGVPLLRSY